MVGKITTAFIKKFLAEKGLGAEKDWSRLSKKKNENGEWVREFKNKATGAEVRVTEKADGALSIEKAEDKGARAAANDAFAPADDGEKKGDKSASSQMLPSTPMVDTDPQRKALAADIVNRMLKGRREDEDFDDEEDFDEEEDFDDDNVDKDLIKRAGKALANQFGFGIGFDPYTNSIVVLFAPLKDTSYDQHVEGYIGHLLPKELEEESEGHFGMSAKEDDFEAVAEDLLRRGFVWNEYLQMHAEEAGYPKTWAKKIAALEKKLQQQEKKGSAPKQKPWGPK